MNFQLYSFQKIVYIHLLYGVLQLHSEVRFCCLLKGNLRIIYGNKFTILYNFCAIITSQAVNISPYGQKDRHNLLMNVCLLTDLIFKRNFNDFSDLTLSTF